MRGNAPIGDFNFPDPFSEPTQELGFTREELELAKIGNSPDWKIIRSYLEERVDKYKKALYGEDLTGMDYAMIGQRFMSAQSVILEFEQLIQEVDTVTKSVTEKISGKEK